VTASPLRLSRERIVLYGSALAVLCLIQVRFVAAQHFGDWSAFWAAGATAGTADLLDPQRHGAWLASHHLLRTIFPYLPGAAWFWYPFRALSLGAGYACSFVLMAIAATGAALLAARAYALPRSVAIVLTFAWAPLIAALATGQNSPLGLLLTMCAIAASVSQAPLAAGLAAGVLLYKLPYALPFVLLFAVRRNLRAPATIALCAIAWYFISVAATGGDWAWPSHYLSALHGYFGADFRYNADKSLSIPALLMRAGLSPALAFAVGAAIFAIALPLMARAALLEAASFAPLIALACNSHTLPYDAALALPALFYVMTTVAEPVRTRLICAFYLAAPLWLLSGVFHFDVLAVLCDGLALSWIVKGYYESTARSHLRIADSRDRS
jgi:hypothetical protein